MKNTKTRIWVCVWIPGTSHIFPAPLDPYEEPPMIRFKKCIQAAATATGNPIVFAWEIESETTPRPGMIASTITMDGKPWHGPRCTFRLHGALTTVNKDNALKTHYRYQLPSGRFHEDNTIEGAIKTWEQLGDIRLQPFSPH